MAAITWKQKKAALRAMVAMVLKLDRPDSSVVLADGTFENTDSEAVQWENERGASRSTKGVWADLRLGVIVPISQDETRYEYDPDTDLNLPTYGGFRRFSVMVIIATDDQEDYEAVGEVAGRLRTRIHRPEALALLEAANIGYTSLGQTMNVDYPGDDGVMYSQSMTEIMFETSEADEPEADQDGSYIGEVLGDGDLYVGVDGEPINAEISAGPVP
jgi:hypothetical protein